MHVGRLAVVAGLSAITAGAVWAVWPARGGEEAGKRTVLVTGFGPFGPYETNPAWESIRKLDGTTVGGLTVRTARIDVVYAKAGPQIQEALDRVRPDVVLSLGVAPDPWIRLETTARNRDNAAAPDNVGEMRRDVAIREGAAATIPTRLPLEEIAEALRAKGYEVRTSDDAGGYLCNHLFYELMSRLPPERVAGFIHVPPTQGPWDLPRLEAAVRTILESLGRPAPAVTTRAAR